jgi:hypothetical protein
MSQKNYFEISDNSTNMFMKTVEYNLSHQRRNAEIMR